MSRSQENIQNTQTVWDPHPLEKKLKPFEILFQWVYWFYPKAKEFNVFRLLYYFIPQKVLRINGNILWPVHLTSTIQHQDKISVGKRVEIGKMPNQYIQGYNNIVLGNNIRVGPGVKIVSAEVESNDYDAIKPSQSIRIGDNVWIGMNVVIMPGVSIGDNVVISANATVERDIPSNSIAAGNPCRVIRQKPPYQGKNYAPVYK